MTRTVSAAGMDWGTLAAAGMLTIVPGASVIWFVRNYIAKGFALGGCEDGRWRTGFFGRSAGWSDHVLDHADRDVLHGHRCSCWRR